MSAQRARETVEKRRSEEDLSQMEMEEYATEAEKKSLVDRQVRLSRSYLCHFGMLHNLNNSHGSANSICMLYCIFCYMLVVNCAGIFFCPFSENPHMME